MRLNPDFGGAASTPSPYLSTKNWSICSLLHPSASFSLTTACIWRANWAWDWSMVSPGQTGHMRLLSMDWARSYREVGCWLPHAAIARASTSKPKGNNDGGHFHSDF